jgi:hypothetical protein
VEREDDALILQAGDITVRFPKSGADFALVRSGSRSWKVPRQQ